MYMRAYFRIDATSCLTSAPEDTTPYSSLELIDDFLDSSSSASI